ncbi:uncharacterized protein B0H18DRAFT_952512 [Fomitopsis serialis]|uniref:uncharacterized protein n=1 Tax=Fomitopsis serialis TaxID=139415 RepID=UPI0020077BB1|nr:uncharacterized protein B0H18DRAFT_954107 [Neoantrodia serialis]XP_047896881.1 uncharacterized protein B0H18DRAFT_952512 [Neoantrodia serialis]KAH9928112.1 hypothetical protein B0H18DRAFT_954107 [Neoantrodia serialis]KAH9931828.1 hypothetical protein B0H18DRAFT_952512 [Neoantrodia serialis]
MQNSLQDFNGWPIRATHAVCDGDLITSPLDLTATFPSQSKTASYYDDGVDGTFALWASSGGTAYVGMYTVGASYPSNSDVSKCTDSGSICHQDDIEIIFLSTGNATSGWYATWDATEGLTVSPSTSRAVSPA